jgi:hypothetical protein
MLLRRRKACPVPNETSGRSNACSIRWPTGLAAITSCASRSNPSATRASRSNGFSA